MTRVQPPLLQTPPLGQLHPRHSNEQIVYCKPHCTKQYSVVQCRVFSPQSMHFPIVWCAVYIHFAACSLTKHNNMMIQGLQDSSNQSEIVMIKLYSCGPGYCSRYPLLYYFFQIRNGLRSSVFKLCCKDSAKPCVQCFQLSPSILTVHDS